MAGSVTLAVMTLFGDNMPLFCINVGIVVNRNRMFWRR